MDLIDSGRSQQSPHAKVSNNGGTHTFIFILTVKNILFFTFPIILFYFVENNKDAENREKALNNQNQNLVNQEQKKPIQQPSGNPVKNYVLEQLAKLMTTCIVIRIDDFTLYKVTTSSRKTMPKEFISGNSTLCNFESMVLNAQIIGKKFDFIV